MTKTYKIIRFHRQCNNKSNIIVRGLTLQEAQEHCKRADTHKIDKNGEVVWFDGYTEE